MNYWILCSLLVLERYYSAGKHRLSLGCRAMSLQQRRQCLSSTSEFRWLWRNLCVRVCIYCVFRVILILNAWYWSSQMKRVDFLVPKQLRKSKIGLLEQIWAKNPYVTFFLGHPVHRMLNVKNVKCQECLLSRMSIVKTVKCQQCQMSTMSNINNAKCQ